MEQMSRGIPDAAVDTVRSALTPPANLGENRHYLANTSHLHLALGEALDAADRRDEAIQEWENAAGQHSDFVNMSPEDFSEGSYFAIRALQHLGEHARARELTNTWQAWLDEWAAKSALTPYFATSLPELLLFSVDPEAVRNSESGPCRATSPR